MIVFPPRKVRRALGWLAVTIGLTGLVACHPFSVTGSYLAQDDHQVDWIQITETPDQHITGAWTRRWFDEKGDSHQRVFALSGVIDQQQMALRAKDTEPPGNETPLTVETTLQALRILLPNAQVETLQKAVVTDYQAALTDQERHRVQQADASIVEQAEFQKEEAQRKETLRRANDQAKVEQDAQTFTQNMIAAIQDAHARFEAFRQDHRQRVDNFVNRIRALNAQVNDQLRSSHPNMLVIPLELQQMRQAETILSNDDSGTGAKIEEGSKAQRAKIDQNQDFQNWKIACTDPTIRQSDAAKPSDATCKELLDQEDKILALDIWRRQAWIAEQPFMAQNVQTVHRLYDEARDNAAHHSIP